MPERKRAFIIDLFPNRLDPELGWIELNQKFSGMSWSTVVGWLYWTLVRILPFPVTASPAFPSLHLPSPNHYNILNNHHPRNPSQGKILNGNSKIPVRILPDWDRPPSFPLNHYNILRNHHRRHQQCHPCHYSISICISKNYLSS